MRLTWCFILFTALLFGHTACAAEPPKGPVTPVGNNTPRETGWTTQIVADGLMRPWSVAWLPGGQTMLVTERDGFLRVVENGQTRPDNVQGVPNVFASGQGGLMEVSIHPNFAENRWVYLTYSTGNGQRNRTTLARGTINPALTQLTDVQVLFEVKPDKPRNQHFGSRLLWLDDGSLLMSIGDGGNPPTKIGGQLSRDYAQDLNAHLGKTLRMDENGKPLPPMATLPGADPYVYSYGHRNIQGMALHPETRAIWATEHGSRGGDELNQIKAGANYGWPLATYSVEYGGSRISDRATLPGAVDPAAVWTPCIAPSGLAFYTGDAFPDWRGDLFAGGLVLQQIRRLDFENGRIVGQTTLQFDQRIRDVRMGPDGHLYVLTDEIDGRLLRIVPGASGR